MAKTKISEFDSTPANNTDINGINIAEGMAPSNVNNALRQMMANLKDMNIGSTITMLNTTEEDSDGGRVNKIIFKGEQSGGEESVLGEIQVSHDGTADDQKADLIFKTNDGSDGASPTEAMRIDSEQNIIIGDASKGGSLGQVRIINDASSNPASLALFGHNNVSDGADFAKIQLAMQTGGVGGNVVAQITGEAEGTGENAAHLTFETATGGTLSEAMRIRSDGIVSINDTTDPTANGFSPKLHLKQTSDGAFAAFTIEGHNSDVVGALGYSASNNALTLAASYRASAGYKAIDFHTGGSIRTRITSDGKLLIGKTSDAAAGTGFIFGAGNIGAYSTLSSGNTWHVHDTANYKFYVSVNGGIANYQANNVNLSDQREKKNIETLDDKWDAVKAWTLKKFHYNSEEDSDPKKFGVIAQDLETDHPELIADFILNPAQEEVIDEDGNVTTEASDAVTRKSVKEQQMMWMAIKALQEAMAKIETLETRVAALEG